MTENNFERENNIVLEVRGLVSLNYSQSHQRKSIWDSKEVD